ncbi:group III truncated hemoglobin [Mycolicibacterium psychrotolerans]|uniref:group III truncated hemoglobin n=1 Tax=Mycolicibacterium psychrotolerans TaxID=216929 RepID=UPI001FEC763F|nr:group III truncated hemoglobin [Mycolicibacterium psychrotolerans]
MNCTADSGAPAAGLRDLGTRTDIEVLLRRFYNEAFRDEVLAPPFAELASRGLEQHLPVMCDFWETVLFRAGLYRRNALTVHRRINDCTPLSALHFTRWLALWTATVDQMYQGPVAEHAKIQAGRIATAMNRRLTGAHDPGRLHRSVRTAVKEEPCGW